MTRKGWLLFISMSVVWGIPYLFIKIAVRELDPAVVVFCRVGIAAAVLLPLAVQRGVLRQVRERMSVAAKHVVIEVSLPRLALSGRALGDGDHGKQQARIGRVGA